jgi:prepilin-type N-terminal cleavage/methylation domain-containing protein
MMAMRHNRGFTVVELLISISIMGIVLGLAVVEFAMVFNHNNLLSANLSAEQTARISMTRVTNELRQAMPDLTDFPTSNTVVTAPLTGSSSSISFYRVHDGPGGFATPIPTTLNGDPVPCYDLVTLSYDNVAHTISKTVTLQTNTNCSTASTTTSVLARNVVGFNVTEVTTYLYDIDLQTVASKGNYGIYDLNSQVAMGYTP